MSEHEVELTADEKQAMTAALASGVGCWDYEECCWASFEALLPVVAGIVAARLADAEARVGAAKQAMIEALDEWFGHHEPCDGRCDLTDAHLCDVETFLTPSLREALRGDQ